MKSTLTPPTVADYDRIFEAERLNEYPMVDAFEQRMGFALDRQRLEDAARVLACPLKDNPPNWQHGRVLYALTVGRGRSVAEPLNMLDIGTAKSFSALCLLWGRGAAPDGVWVGSGGVTSVDVLDPLARVRRNTVAEVGGYKTLAEILEPWPEAGAIRFERSTGFDWLKRHPERIHVAFVDGKHEESVVREEGRLLADRQEPGDVVMFDDVQIPGVAKAVAGLKGYEFEYLEVKPERKYAIGVRR
jgi:predicted O-methyltransferase YrrM